jgi:hypothetical protein
MAVAHRVQQGLRALFAFAREVDEGLAARYLTSAQFALFRQMARSEQLHSLQVLRDVLAQSARSGEGVPDDLAGAALLHDVGKSRYRMAIWQKTIPVLLYTVSPALCRRFAASDERNWFTRPFVVNGRHPIWSEQLVAAAGGSERLLWLVRHHADKPEMWQGHPHLPLLVRLQQADNAN